MKYYQYIWILLVALAFVACKEDELAPIAQVEIEDANIEVSYREANISWQVKSNATANEVLLEYALDSAFKEFKQEKMSLEDPKSDNGLYSCVLKSLNEGTKYYFRCRAINKINSYTSDVQSFKTKEYHLPVVHNDSVSSITTSSAQLHATLLDWGTDTIPEVGFCFATHENVTMKDSCIICLLNSKKDTIAYSWNFTNLEDNVKYFVRAYAKNNKGVSYGEEYYFTTTEVVLPQVGDVTISEISYTTAEAISEVLSDGGASIIERGVCYSTTQNPTISDSKIISGSGLGSFKCALTGLNGETTYYVRAYAINSKGISYSNEVSFSTAEYRLPSITTSVATDVSYTTATCGGNVTDDGGLSVSERGVCYSTTQNPTIANTKIISGNGLGSFVCNLSGLKMSVTYYVRAYAINSKGTAYGEEISFTTETGENMLCYTANSKLSETTSTDATSTGLHVNSFNVSIVSHDFDNGEGIIIFNGKLTNIGDNAFRGCSGLTSVMLPNSVTTIGAHAFDYTGLISIEIPNSVTSIGSQAFRRCSSLTEVNIHDISAWCNILFNNGDSNPLAYAHHLFINGVEVSDLIIPNSITTIGDYVFYGCSGLTSVMLPNSVVAIGAGAFYKCDGLNSVIIPNSVTSIRNGAFGGCSSLTSITIPNSVTSIGNSAFGGCSGLTSITIGNNVTCIERATFLNCSSLTSVTIPNSVTSIGAEAFYNCSSLTSVTIPNSVTSIGFDAFHYCSSLTSVTIPNSVTSIEYNAFIGCSGLTSISIGSSVTSIGSNAFYKCSSLTSITIPNSVTSIGNSAFGGCSGLTSISIGSSVTSIGSNAFYKCSSLISIDIEADNPSYSSQDGVFFDKDKNILIKYPEGKQGSSYSIPNSVTSIDNYAFYNCSSLTSITIPNSVTSIGDSAFRGCNGLNSLTIGNSVTSLGSYAFDGCRGLTLIICNAVTPPTCNQSFGSSVSKNIPVYVPAASVNAYQQAYEWKNFTNILPISE